MVAEIAASSEVPGTEQLVDCQLDSAVAREFHDAFAGGGRWGGGAAYLNSNKTRSLISV